MKTAAELNNGYHTPDEVRRILGEIIGQEVDESVTLLPPFYVDYGKHIKIGKGCFIQQCCTFSDVAALHSANMLWSVRK